MQPRLLAIPLMLARLAHPNVVAVYHTGMHDDQVYIAMEFVAGRDLDEWIRDEPRSWRKILAVYRQAGRGLAAAHSAGLAHRDFKPGNAILGEDGRVRVLDFGLARPVSDPSELDSAALTAVAGGRRSGGRRPGDPADHGSALTEPGAIHGTPAYMAPEQLAGQSADARSDQFSFCSALWEAIYDTLPFPGATVDDRLAAMRRDEVSESGTGPRLPAWLRRAILRSLKAEPEERHPSMDALLALLDRDSGARWRRLAMVAAAAVLVLSLAASWWQSAERQARRCRSSAETRLAGVWDEARSNMLSEAFLASAVSYAEPSYRQAVRTLDDYAGD